MRIKYSNSYIGFSPVSGPYSLEFVAQKISVSINYISGIYCEVKIEMYTTYSFF